MAFRRKKKRILRRLAPALVLAGGATASSLIASGLPAGSRAGLQSASSGMAGFVGPAATVGGAAIAVDMLKDIKPRRKKRRRK